MQIGPDVCTTIAEIAHAVVRISGKEIDIHFDTTKPEGDKGRRADYAKARDVLGWKPRMSLQEGLASLYAWIEKKSEAIPV